MNTRYKKIYNEYLVFPTDGDINDLNRLLYGRIKTLIIINENNLRFGKLNIKKQVRSGITASGEQYFQIHLESQYKNEKEIESFCNFIDLAEKVIGSELDKNFQVLKDSLSLYYSNQAYPLIHETENLMRSLITNLLKKKLGGKWIDEALKKSIEEDIFEKASNRNRNINKNKNIMTNQHILQQLDFNKLSECLFLEHRDEIKVKRIFRGISTASNKGEISEDLTWDACDSRIDDCRKLINKLKRIGREQKKLIDELLKEFLPQSNWERHFVHVVNCERKELQSLWGRLNALRCDVAHNKRFDKQKLVETVQSTSRLKEILNSANDKVNTISFSAVEQDELEHYFNNIIDPASDEELETRAKSGDVSALRRLAQRKLLEENYDQAFHLLKKLTETHDIDSLYRLGQMCEYGEGIQKDISKAIKYYGQAAELGDTRSQFCLGQIYEDELKDFKEAERYYENAAMNNHVKAQWCLASIYVMGRQDDIDPKKSVFADALKGFDWCSKAGQNGDPEAQFQLARMYKAGEGTKRDSLKAFEWYRRAWDNGAKYPLIQYEIGCCYLKGEGVERNAPEALIWLERAGESQFDDACMELAKIYDEGTDGIPANNKKAKYWYGIAAEKGNTNAQYSLAELLCYDEDYENAFRWYKKAAEKNDPDAQYEIGVMYMNGQGIDKTYALAKEWFEKTISNRDAGDQLIRLAQQRLDEIEFGD